MKRLPIGISEKLGYVIGILICMQILSVWSIALGQSDVRMASIEQRELSFRSEIKDRMNTAARAAGVSLLPGELAYVGGNEGMVINSAISSDGLPAQPGLTAGTDLLFTYVGIPGLAVPVGYYKVRLIGDQARFIASNGQVTATLPAKVSSESTTTANATKSKPKIKVTIELIKNGIIIDIHFDFAAGRMESVEIPIQKTAVR